MTELLSPKDSVLLTKVKIACAEIFSDAALEDMRITRDIDEYAGEIAHHFQTRILGETVHTLDETVPFEVPSSTWQFFKWEFFPKWLLRYLPVRTYTWNRTVHFSQIQCFPKIKQMLPSEETSYEFTHLGASLSGFSPFSHEQSQ